MTVQPVIAIRPAVPADAGLILAFIRELGEYERLSHEVVADEAGLAAQLFGERPRAEVLIAEVDGAAAGFALFSTISRPSSASRPYLEDLCVRRVRGHGVGKRLRRGWRGQRSNANAAASNGRCWDGNTPAIDFYRSSACRHGRMDSAARQRQCAACLGGRRFPRR